MGSTKVIGKGVGLLSIVYGIFKYACGDSTCVYTLFHVGRVVDMRIGI
jgi:hypothetical protein